MQGTASVLKRLDAIKTQVDKINEETRKYNKLDKRWFYQTRRECIINLRNVKIIISRIAQFG